MKVSHYLRLQDKYPDEYVVTDNKTGRLIAHSHSMRKLFAELKRKQVDPQHTVLEKFPPKNAVLIY